MSPRPNVSAERIPQILNAAMLIFSEKGLHQATMADIAQEAGLSKGTVYLYFKDKDELVFSVLKASLDQGYGNLEKVLETDGYVKDSLLDWIQELAAQMEESAVYLSIGYEFYALAGRKESVRRHLHDYFVKYRKLLSSIVELGKENGEFVQVDSELVAVAIIAVYEGVNVLWSTEPTDESWGSICVRTNQLLLDSISSSSR